MTDGRHYPRLDAPVLWRPVGLVGPHRPTVDVSLGGMRVYSDELLKVGMRLELDLRVDGGRSLDFLARVVRVEVLPVGGPAAFDVALEFLDVTPDVQKMLEARLSSTRNAAREAPRPSDRPLGDDKNGQQDLFQPPSRVRATTSHDGGRESEPRDRVGETRRRLRVLFVTPYLPSPPRFGGQARLHGLISGMAKLHDVSVLSFVEEGEDQTEAMRATEAYCRRVVTVPNPRYSAGGPAKRLLQMASMFSARSYGALVHRHAAFDDALDQVLARDRYDVVCFELAHMAAYQHMRRRREEGPLFVLDEHNIEYELGRQTADAGASPVRRAYSVVEWRKVRDEERRTWSQLDGCTLTSERDRDILLADVPKTRTAVVPNGVDVEHFRPLDTPAPASGKLLFFGAIDYHPNTEGLLYFLDEVFPLLRTRNPRVTLSVVGRRPPPEILARRAPHVEITGAVDDVRPHIASAAVVVVPLRLGSGTRLKILEAMAMGRPVVSTTLGAEGLAVAPDRHLLIADDAKTFDAQVRRLLDDPVLAARLGAAGRRLVTERYGWQSSVQRLSTFYGELLDARAAP